MAKVQQKSEKITAFGGIFFVLDKFDSILSSVIDSHLGLRSTLIGYQYSEIIRAHKVSDTLHFVSMQQDILESFRHYNCWFLHHYFHISSAKIIIFVHNEC